MESKKIAVICNYRLMPERVGGMDYFYWLFDAECKAKGYEVTWFFPNKSTHGEYENLTIISAKNEPLETFFVSYIKENKQKFDVVITHFVELCTSFFKKVKKVCPSKTIAIDHNPRPFEGYPLKKKIAKRIKGFLYSRHTDIFIGVSVYTANEILKDFGQHLKSKTTVIYNGILHEKFEKRINRNSKKPTFLVASHLRYSKGIQDLIASVALLPKAVKDELKIDIYGEGHYRETLEQQIRTESLENVFNFKGSVSNLYETYCKYDYLLQPTHMECFSLSVLESLSANVPVITTNVGGNEEAVKHNKNGFIFQAKNIRELNTLIESIYHGNIGITINTSALIEEEFTIQKMVNEHLAIIEKIA